MIVGSIVALVTPMQAGSLAVDWSALRHLVDWHIARGTDGIAAVGTTGESATLDVDEHLDVVRVCVEQAAGRVPVIAGTGANSTAEAIQLTQGAKAVGADACLLVVPYYNKPTQEGLYRHFRAVAEAVAIPQLLYNVPTRTACDLVAETVLRLAAVPNIVGIKEATGDLRRAQELMARAPTTFAVYSGDDATAVELILLGGKGNISVTANVAPQLMHELCAAALAGDAERARALNRVLEPLHRALFVESNPIPVKWALGAMGLLCGEAIRLPLTPLAAELRASLHEVLDTCGLLPVASPAS